MPWNPPATTGLSSNDCEHVTDGLLDPASRYTALTFVGTLTDPGLLRVIACRVAERRRLPVPPVAGGSSYLAFIRDNT
jgi:hypothetical protein